MKQLFFILGFFTPLFIGAQTEVIFIKNGSFEAEAQKGAITLNLKNWVDCGQIDFPNSSPPDIHGGDTDFWSVKKAPQDGETYLGLVIRESGEYESISQRLASPLKAGTCYSFSIYLAQSDQYLSQTKNSGPEKVSFVNTTEFLLWGGSGYCNPRQNLVQSKPIDHTDWIEYTFIFKPDMDLGYITLMAFYVGEENLYNGHLLIDQMSDITELDECPE